jgi:diacylglycerol kinase (ATP)
VINPRKLAHAFRYAFAGIGHALKTQQNFKIYFLVVALVVGAGLYFGISFLEWIALVFSIFLVFITEMINTAFEEMINLLKCDFDRHCRIAKDVAAGMVLFASISAVIVGILIFLPRIIG